MKYLAQHFPMKCGRSDIFPGWVNISLDVRISAQLNTGGKTNKQQILNFDH
jgi:hypothetical protein